FERLAGERGHRDRHVLQALFAFLRSDDDLLEAGIALRGVLRPGGSRKSQRKRRRRQNGAANLRHAFSPIFLIVASSGLILTFGNHLADRGTKYQNRTTSRTCPGPFYNTPTPFHLNVIVSR